MDHGLRGAWGWCGLLLPGLLVCGLAGPAVAQANAFGVPSAPDGQTAPAPSPFGQAPPADIPAFGDQPQRRTDIPAPMPAPVPTPVPMLGPAPMPSPGPGFGPAPPVSAPISMAQYIVSLWRGQVRDNTGAWDVYVNFRQDGSFMQSQTLQGGQFQLKLAGRYQPRLAPDGGSIAFELLQWEPRQVCNGSACQPLNLPHYDTVPIQLLGRDSFQTPYGRFQRIGPAQ